MQPYWQRYRTGVLQRCGVKEEGRRDMQYWRGKLFAEMLVYLYPLSLLAIFPGIGFSIANEAVAVTIVDVFALVSLSVATLANGLTLRHRKLLFIGSIYVVALLLLAYVGLPGPGQIYLLAASMFGLLFTQNSYRFWYPTLNTIIVLGMTLAVAFGYHTPTNAQELSAANWLVVVSNTIFLSYLFAILLSTLVDQLEKQLTTQQMLAANLQQEQNNLQAAMQKLEAKNADMEQFAYFASHDLREPLRMVTAFMQQLKTKYGQQLDEKGHTYIDFATDGARRMERLIDDLLQYSRTGRNIQERELVPASEVITEVMMLLRSSIQESSAQIEVDDLPVLNASKTALRLLFQNLISNAIKYQPKGQIPQIHISATREGSHWLFKIVDNGIGISGDHHDRIFQLFQRLQNRQQYPGSGIGLAICKKIVEMMDGRIWVESAENQGATFKFTIPADSN